VQKSISCLSVYSLLWAAPHMAINYIHGSCQERGQGYEYGYEVSS